MGIGGFLKGAGKGVVGGAEGLIDGVVGLAGGAWDVATDPVARGQAWETAQAAADAAAGYASGVVDDPAKPFRDLGEAASSTYDSVAAAHAQAVAEGREAEFWGKAAGGALFEVGTALVPVSKLGMIGRAAGALEEGAGLASKAAARIDSAADAVSAARKAEAAGDLAKTVPDAPLKGVEPCPLAKLTPGTPEHKSARWAEYQENGGTWSHERWSRQYDTNMRNVSYGLQREREYRDALGGENRIVATSLTYRQIDVYLPDDHAMAQVKTGMQYLTEENKLAIAKDAELVELGTRVVHVLENGASKPYMEALQKAGVDVVSGMEGLQSWLNR